MWFCATLAVLMQIFQWSLHHHPLPLLSPSFPPLPPYHPYYPCQLKDPHKTMQTSVKNYKGVKERIHYKQFLPFQSHFKVHVTPHCTHEYPQGSSISYPKLTKGKLDIIQGLNYGSKHEIRRRASHDIKILKFVFIFFTPEVDILRHGIYSKSAQ